MGMPLWECAIDSAARATPAWEKEDEDEDEDDDEDDDEEEDDEYFDRFPERLYSA